jgi:hypothetical protein
MGNKRLINVQKPTESNDAVNKKYYHDRLNRHVASVHIKNEDIDMNNKIIKNLSWSNDNNDDDLRNIFIIIDCCWIINLTVLMLRIKNCECVRP